MSCVLDAWLAARCGVDADADLPAALARHQLAALRRTLRHALAHSPFYRHTLAGLDPDLPDATHLAALPCTTARDLRRWGDFLCVSQGDVRRLVTLRTSGTTDAPKRLAFTDADLARTREFFAVGMGQLVGAGDSLLILLPGAERPDGVADLLRQALTPRGVTVCAGDALCTPERLAADLERRRPHCLVAGPQQLRVLLEVRRRALTTYGPRGILASGALLDAATRRALETAFACTVLDHYGLTETCFGGGVQCPAREGYHWRELDLLPEVVDPETGRPLPPGSWGELVVTTLDRQAMPLIRYRTGDVTALLEGPCPCGSPLRRLAPIRGRLRRDGSHFIIENPQKGSYHARHAALSL